MSDARPDAGPPAALHLCPGCGSGMVQPLDWEPAGDRRRWRVSRRCPECGWHGEGIHGEAAIEAYDEELDRGARELAAALQRRQHENMAALAAAFAAALAADLIGADDFAPRRAPRPAATRAPGRRRAQL